jgi:glutamate racemase
VDSNAPIGIFDSGVGGLTVVKELCRLLPEENFIYVGDTARVPYGSREPKEIIRFMRQILNFFQRQNVKMAVVACNTMTTYGYPVTKDMYPFPIVPMNSAVGEASLAAPHKKIGVIATQATVKNAMHSRAAEQIDASLEIYAKACPDFVPLIENGHIAGAKIEAAAKNYLKFFKGIEIDALILGCTHYPIIKDVLQKYVGKNVSLINPARATALDAVRVLNEKNMLGAKKGARLKICFSDDLDKARKMVKLVLNSGRAEYKLINFDEY